MGKRKVGAIAVDIPWISRAVAIRGGNYRQIEAVNSAILGETASRLRLAAELMDHVRRQFEGTGQVNIDVVGVKALNDAVVSVERHTGLISDCITQFVIQHTIKAQDAKRGK